jgi:ABC-type transporter Mla MlaB component
MLRVGEALEIYWSNRSADEGTTAAGQRKRATRMLRITITEMATEQRWTLEGRLVQPWVGELRANWKNRNRPQNGRTCTVDLSQITCIDNSGLRLLRTMSKEGTNFIATGIYTKHVLEQLKGGTKHAPFIWFLCLFAAFLANAIACSPSMLANPELGKKNARHQFGAHLNTNNGSNAGAFDFAGGPGGTLCPHS